MCARGGFGPPRWGNNSSPVVLKEWLAEHSPMQRREGPKEKNELRK